MQIQPIKLKKQKTLINVSDIDLLKSINPEVSKEQKKQVFNLIYQLKIKQHPEFKQKLSQVFTERNPDIEELFKEFKMLMEYFKDHQMMTPIIDIYYSVYRNKMIEKSSNVDIYWNNWKSVPHNHLQDYFNTFKFDQIVNKTDPIEFYNIIRQLLLKGKNKEAALYYRIFNLKDKDFLLKEMLPRLLQGQDMYSSYVTNLFKDNVILLDAIVEEVDPVAGIRIVETVGGDVGSYSKLIQHLQYSAFKHNSSQFKDWFKCEQIFSFCPLFLQWYADQYLEDPIKTSLLVRNKLKEGQETVENPLFSKDDFTYTQQIIGKHKDKKYWKLSDLGLNQTDVLFIDDDTSQQFKLMEKTVLQSRIVGFDSEFKATSHKHQSSGVSIIQLSASKKVFIIDFIKLCTSEKTINFLKTLFQSKQILKLGHSLKCDFLYLSKTINLDTQSMNSFIDIADLFKAKYPQQNQSSLSYIVLALTGVLLSKYQQRSNWNKRPLRRAQTHYAALDAYICQIIYDKLNQEDIELTSLKLEKTQKVTQIVIQEGWLSYGPEYSHLVAKPKFLVDNMLKRLSTYLRNLGLDAQYLSVRDFGMAISMASNEGRVIITKDKNLKYKKNIRVPVYLIQSEQSETMTKQVVAAFNLKLEDYDLLSRCVKCNNSELVLVDREEALFKLNFKNKDSPIHEFWSCTKCDQIYWEGHSYNNSRKRFSSFL